MNSYTFGEDVSAGLISTDEYGQFFSTYIQYCKEKTLMEQFESGEDTLSDLLFGLSDEKMMYRYEPGKWSVKQIVGHIMDTERVMAFRALSFARGEKQAFPGYDHDQYVEQANFDERSAQDLLMEYRAVRESTILLFSSLTSDMLMKRGSASNVEFTVRALGFIICGHELHHIKILKERYLTQLS